jgi:hypothetical protein
LDGKVSAKDAGKHSVLSLFLNHHFDNNKPTPSFCQTFTVKQILVEQLLRVPVGQELPAAFIFSAN